VRLVRFLLLSFFIAGLGIAQDPAFTVASIRPHGNSSDPDGFDFQGNRFIAKNLDLETLIRLAYKVDPFGLAGVEKWMKTERFDIAAEEEGVKTPPTNQVFLQMLKRLLADRFQLRTEERLEERPIYSIRVAQGGPKLKASGEQTKARYYGKAGHIEATHVSPGTALVPILKRVFQRPVQDDTGLTGVYDFTLDFDPEGRVVGADLEVTDYPALFVAIKEQLGLEVVSTKGPVPILVITRASRPAEN
jgi:uncharacterized protein (TIGR03435 family)